MANLRLLCVLLFLSVSPWVNALCFTIAKKSFRNGANLGRPWSSSITLAANTDHLFPTNVHVYDNVVSPDACEALRYLASEHADRCGGSSSIFYWNGSNMNSNNNNSTKQDNRLLTPLEQALQSILEQLLPEDVTEEDPSRDGWIVEYWSREEHMNMDAHSDIDEQLLLKEGIVRCPDHAHVLYLEVDPQIRGPTCVFSKERGWRPYTTTTTSLITVPAVPGRLLRFPGASMHAVPQPSSLWFLDETNQAEIRAVQEEAETDMDWDEDDEDEDDPAERCVVLFNLWRDRGPGGKTEDLLEKGMLPEGIGLADQDNSYIEQERERRVTQWNQEYGRDCRNVWCHPRDLWKAMAIVDTTADDERQTIRVPLMGNKARRFHPQKLVCLSSPSSLASALQERTTPRHFLLHEEE